MSPTPLSGLRLDHVKVLVPDRSAAVEWYQQVLGLRIMRGPHWDAAAALPNGPLFLGVDDTTDCTKVVLFEGEPLGTHSPTGLSRASFSVDAASFLRFLDRLDELGLMNEDGERLTRDHLVDQWVAWSLYFNDPYGNRYELLTYEYDAVHQQIDPVAPAQS